VESYFNTEINSRLMPHLRLSRLASAQPVLASCSAKLSRREKRWSRRVVEHSVLASTIVSQDFLDLSATGIRFGGFLVCGPRTPFLLDRFARTRVP
jgi:hypothetical protein